ncbi:MAG: hypothetical protein CVU67_07225 [Deltaproteobacteria bacterium HGW-Deltaproteobacteria-24]|jgi:predicted neutral ceramidase superfamily lipid hydrolase|nr:MAG: hypothetical protein CVU67_07225 [Deltaproteobacteria bacterium HGW-Deltaproteobacteria-24]
MFSEVIRVRPEIALDDFLPIFLSSSFVLVFGVLFVGVYTLVKMKLIKGYLMPLAYLFWGLQAYCMYFMAVTIQVGPVLEKILMIAMLAYLTLPHLYYYLNQKADEKYEN